jgi:tetratricopeptide (TPR) repeat protein
MWRSLVVSCVFAATASAAPRGHVASQGPAFAPAEKLWSVARDAADWRAAADAFFALADTAATDADKRAAARSGWAAARNAVGADRTVATAWHAELAPRPLSEVDAWFVHVAEQYEQLDRGTPDAVVAEFIRANTLHSYDQLAAATPLYLDIVTNHRDHDVTEYAANLACDSLIRLEKFDELVAFVEQLRADKAFLARFPKLAHIVHVIHRKSLADRERSPVSLEGSRQPRPYAEYDELGQAYLDAVEPRETDTDELLYNAMVSFEEARDLDRALATGTRFLRELPHAKLAPRVVARMARAEGDVGRYADAARDLERYAALAPGELDVRDALGDALLFRVGLGQLDLAARDLDALAKAPHLDPKQLARSTLGLARSELEAGRRADALHHARAVVPRDADPVALGLVLAELACPVALVDELCPRPRDPKLLALATSVLERATDADDPDDFGRRVLVDLAVEAHTVRDLEDARTRYRELTGDPSETRVVAHERLGRLGVLAQHPDEAAGEFALCIIEARSHTLALEWLQRCERERAALGKPPVVAPLDEHLPAALPGDVTALEHI